MGLEKMMADACALRMRQLADWQADAARRSDDIRALLDVLAHLLDFESAQVVCEFLHDEAVRINRAEWSEEETASWADGICSSIY